jgi:uncharacterized protein
MIGWGVETLWVAFFTGLTTGGLSCMAVQGGLITGSLASQLEHDLAGNRPGSSRGKSRLAFPILLFLAAKLAAYTLLGLLLGWIGSAFALTPVMKGILLMAIAVFMLGNGLRLLNIHPIFRYFTFEPPSFVTRMIRRRSKKAGDFFTPIILGAMTILIPCGITQGMMAVAITTGNAFSGAAIMFAFILGTSPVFFTLTYLATRLGSLIEKYFFRLIAVTLIILALVGFDQGLNLVGSTFSLRQIPKAAVQGWYKLTNQQQASASKIPTGPLSNEVVLTVTNDGYVPEELYAPAGQPLKLHLVTYQTTSCALDFTIPAYNIDVLLSETGNHVLDIPPQAPSTKLHFSCSMGMYVGDIIAIAQKE